MQIDTLTHPLAALQAGGSTSPSMHVSHKSSVNTKTPHNTCFSWQKQTSRCECRTEGAKSADTCTEVLALPPSKVEGFNLSSLELTNAHAWQCAPPQRLEPGARLLDAAGGDVAVAQAAQVGERGADARLVRVAHHVPAHRVLAALPAIALACAHTSPFRFLSRPSPPVASVPAHTKITRNVI